MIVSHHRHSPPLALSKEDPRETNFLSRTDFIHLQSLTLRGVLATQSCGGIARTGRGWPRCFFDEEEKREREERDFMLGGGEALGGIGISAKEIFEEARVM